LRKSEELNLDIFALIPARGGSKSVENKNLQEIQGVTLVEITIQQALRVLPSKNIYVSSDAEEILAIARNFNCETFQRSTETATDEATADQVVQEFISNTGLAKIDETVLIYLQPTSPFRGNQLIQEGLNTYFESTIPIVAVSQVDQHPEKMFIQDTQGVLQPLLDGANPTANRQTLPEVLIPTGSLYVFSVGNFKIAGGIPVISANPYIVSGINALDIDSEIDLKIAQEIGLNGEL
jgi:CMP-N-acetylneuraminic acid synthetase